MDPFLVKVDLHCKSNNSAHYTSDITTDQLIVRRGQHFLLTVDLPKPFQPKSDRLLITATTGSRASEENGTKSVFGIPVGIAASSPGAKSIWKVSIDDSSAPLPATSVTLAVTPPANAPIGIYFLSLRSTDQQETSLGQLVVLFNPWCPEDWVYLPENEERQEYVMNEQGIIYKGTNNFITSMAWDYGQFEKDILDVCLKMLDVNPKYQRDPAADVSARCNPIYVGRVVSAMINANDDRGVLVGCWDNKYYNGSNPSYWTGSVEILQRWNWLGFNPVKYGQCWVFAGVMCTVLRCLGIPCRVITNFQSAHDTNRSLTIDVFHTDMGVQPGKTTDSVWNFHVWVEAWMKRPDLKEDGSYDGWQVLDPTPQEKSEGVFCCGPASVNAILNGDTDLKYDVPFIFAEVNADCIDWLIMKDGSKQLLCSDTTRVGQNISTKSVGSNKRRNITDNYKHREGTDKERTTFKHALTRAEENIPPTTEGTARVSPPTLVVSMRLEEVNKPVAGRDVSLRLLLSSKDRADRHLSVNISVQAMSYTGLPAAQIHSQLTQETLTPGKELCVPIVVPFSVYGKPLLNSYSLKVSAVATDTRQPDKVYLSQKDIAVQGPPISITVVGEAQQDREMTVEVMFENPISDTLTECCLTITGSGLLTSPVSQGLAVLRPGQRVRFRIMLFPYKSGEKTLLVNFDCSAFRNVKASCSVNVKPYI